VGVKEKNRISWYSKRLPNSAAEYFNTKNSTKAMAEAMLTYATTVKTTRNSGRSTTKAKCERAQQNWMKKSANMRVRLRKMVWLSIGLQVAVSGK
jgi:hypothetical protein